MARVNLRYLVAAVLATAAFPAAAQTAAPDTSNWKCESCPFFEGYESEATAGAAYAQGANYSFGRYSGIDEEKVHVDAGAAGQWRTAGGTTAGYVLEDLGLDSRSGRLAFGREGAFDVALTYDGLPYRRYDTTRTPFAGVENLTLPSSWVRAGTTGTMTQLAGALRDREIETERRTYGLSARWLAGRNWSVFADYRRQEKEGTGVVYGSFLFQAIELPEPVDYVTDTVELGTQWSSARASARLAYTGSFFRNLNVGLTFQNPFTPILPSAASGRLALAPDNQAQQIGLTGNYRFAAFDTVLSYSASVGEMTQDDALLPVSTAAGAVAPRESLDGKIDTMHYGLALTLRPTTKLSVRGSVRYDERDDATAPLSVAYIVTDTFAGGTDVTPRYGFERMRFDGSVEYPVLRWLRVGGGLQYDTIERTQSEVGKTVEDGGFLRVRLTPWDAVSFAVKAGELHREASDFDFSRRDADENPLLRRYNLANRDRDYVDASATWSITDAVTLTLQSRFTDDAYRESPIGLVDGASRSANTNLAWAATEKLSFYGDFGWQFNKSKQLGQARPAGPGWEARHEDELWNAGLGSRWQPSEKWSVSADFVYGESTGDIVLVTAGLPAAYPELAARFGSARVGVQYQYSEALSLQARYVYDSFDEDDWARDGIEPGTVPNLLSLGADAYTHDVSLLSFTFTYRFGTVRAPAESAE